MIGADHLTAARLARHHPDRVRIVVATPPAPMHDTLYRDFDGKGVAEIWVDPEEVGGALDLRCCRGLSVVVHADSYDAGKAVFFRVQEFEPAMAALATPETVVRMTAEGIEQWEL